VLALPTLGDRIGSKRLLLMGGGAFGVLSVVAAFSSSPEMLIICRALLGIAGVITNLGVGPFVTLSTEVIQGAVPPQKAGSAGAVSQTSGEGGVALGLAVLGGIGVALYGSKVVIPSGVPAGAEDATKESLAGATSAAAKLPAAQAHELLTNAQHAFTSAMNVVAVIVAVLAALLAIVAATTLRDAKRPGEGVTAEGAGESAQVAPVES
jgi:DHA2 family multidrug resistance protein-like MFS transporter